MPEPIVTATLIAGGISAGAKLWDYLASKETRELQNQTLQQMTEFNNDLLRRARGKFTEAEIAQIKRNAEPSINAVAGNVAARGLTGPAGAAIVADAQQKPFFAAQDAATKAVPGSLQNLMGIVNQHLAMFEGDDDIAKEFGELIKSYTTLKGLNAIPPGGTPGQGYDQGSPTPPSNTEMHQIYEGKFPGSPIPKF